jgi:hypothetical protein
MDDYIRLNWSVEGQEPGTLVFEDNAAGRLEAAKVFAEQAALPGLRFVEGWRCWATEKGAQRLWEFSPYFPAGTGGIAAQPPESGGADVGACRWIVAVTPTGKVPTITTHRGPADALSVVASIIPDVDVHVLKSAIWRANDGIPFFYKHPTFTIKMYREQGAD